MTLPAILLGPATVIAGAVFAGLAIRALRQVDDHSAEPAVDYQHVDMKPPLAYVRCLPPGGRSTGVYCVGPYKGAVAKWELFDGNRRMNTYTRKFTALQGARRLMKRRADW